MLIGHFKLLNMMFFNESIVGMRSNSAILPMEYQMVQGVGVMDYIIEFIKTVSPDTGTAFVYILLIFLTLWMYKELRKNYMESRKENLLRIEKTIECYSDLDLEIYRYINDKSDFFAITEKISKASSFISYSLLKKFNQCKEEKDIDKKNHLIVELHAEIQKEIISLKLRQSDLVPLKSDDSMFGVIENYIKTKITPFVMPFVQAFLNLILLLSIILLTITVMNASTVSLKILYISLIFVAIIYVMLINLLLDLVILKGRFNNSTLNWFLFSLFVILPPIFFFIGPWYRGIILIVLMFVYASYVSKKSIKEHVS